MHGGARSRARRSARWIGVVLALASLTAPACERAQESPSGADREASAPMPAPERAERVVLVTIDTLRADHVGAYGAGPGRTPALDALAARGVRFEQAISPVPLTLPSHATLLTGRDPPEHRVHHNSLFRLAEDVPTLAAHLRERGFPTAAFVAAFVLDARFGLARGFDVYDDDLALQSPTMGAASAPERPADQVVDAALAWLPSAPDRFFLWVHLYDPHAERRPPEPWATRFAHDPYAGEIAFADAQMGRLVAALDSRWADGATLLVATADHGESLGEHGEHTHAYSLYDATQRVPLIAAGPGLPPGAAIGGVVRLADVAPTVLELLGADPLPGATGRSLLGLVAGGDREPRTAYVETLATQLAWRWSPLFGVRTDRHKYVRAPRPELYDLAEDPGELRNLAAQEPSLVAELDRALDARVSARGPAVPNLELGLDERARLEALGYVAPAPDEAGAAPAGPFGTTGGIDPKDEIHRVAELHRLNELLGQRRFEEALAVAEGLGERGVEIQILHLRAASGAKRYERTRELAARLLKEAPDLPEAHSFLGVLDETDGRADAARAAYERALALRAPSAAPFTGLGRLAEAAGRLEDARQRYEQARAAPIRDPEPTWRLAALELEAGHMQRARFLLAELPPAYLRREDAALRVASAELRAGRRDLARLRVDAALREHPQSLALLTLKGRVLEADGDPRGARAAREERLRVAPEDPGAQNDLAWSLARLGEDLPRARALAEAATAALGRAPAALDTLAAVQLAERRPAEALEVVEEGLRSAAGGDRALLLYRRAEALGDLGRRAEAEAALAEAGAAAGAAPSPELAAEEARIRARLDAPPHPAS
jgi:arylsulfatase A-like enzyme/tetratricopeptide (TPR) repeat protein